MKKKYLFLAAALLAMPFSAEAEYGYVDSPVTFDGSAAVYEYEPYNQYVVYAKVGYVTDIVLRPGEEVQKIAAGNTLQWAVEKDDVAGLGHVYIKPLADSTTNVIINTSARSYRLLVTTGHPEYMNFVVRWNYPHEEEAERQAAMAAATEAMKEQNALAEAARARTNAIHIAYKCVKNKNVIDRYIPKSVFDDGKKTYIEITQDNTQNMPVVYYYDDYDKSKLQLANYRLKGNFLEIDRVMNNIKLQYSQKSYLLITREDDDENVPSTGDIHFNDSSKEDLSSRSLAAGKKQSDVVELKDTAPMSLKERLEEKQRQRALEALRAANGSDTDDSDNGNSEDDALARIAAALEEDGGSK